MRFDGTLNQDVTWTNEDLINQLIEIGIVWHNSSKATNEVENVYGSKKIFWCCCFLFAIYPATKS